MKARHHARSIATLAALAAASGSVSVGAQTQRQPPRADTPRMVVQVFGSADKSAGPAASDALRERLIRSFPSRVVWVFSKADVIGFIEQSGYDPNEQLGRSDESTLAKFLRADEYIRGSVVKDGEVYRVTAQLVLTRDPALRQPLPPATDRRADRAAEELVASIKDAREQLDNERRCIELARADKLDEAVAVADAGIKDYPNATLVRYCKVNVLIRRQAPQDQLLAAANEILALDANSSIALRIAADAQNAMGNTDAANELLVRLLSTDPTNSALATLVVDALAASRKYDVAKEIVEKAVQDNPGDIGLLRLKFLILSSSGDYKPAIQVGEELVQMDTSLADTSYFVRMAALYSADSQPQKAAEAAARGTQKFASNAGLWQLHAQTLRQAGQLQQSIAAAKRALEIDPKIPNGWAQVAASYNDLNMPDSALVALRSAKDAGGDPDQVGGISLTIGNRLFRAAAAQQPMMVDTLRAVLPFLHFADSTIVEATAKTNAKYLIGATNYYIAQMLAQGLQASKSCEEAEAGKAAATTAVIYVQQGGRAAPEQAGQLMQGVNQLLPYFDQSIKSLCKR